MSSRFELGGDEYVLVVVDESMSLDVNLRAMAQAAAVERLSIDGVIEVCPGNASYLVHYDPEAIAGEELVERLRDAGDDAGEAGPIPSRHVTIPIWFDDPYTRACVERYADRHERPDLTNLAYTALLNGMSEQELVAAYCSAPWWITMVGFTPGVAFAFQMVPPERMIETPKWRSPRPFTPERSLGHGGAFAGIDPVDEPGGYQLLGRTPVPIYDPAGNLPGLNGSLVLARPADRWYFRPIDGERYREIREAVAAGTYRYEIVEQTFEPERYAADGAAYLDELDEHARAAGTQPKI